ncbi:MAG: hypothetical protein ACXV7D_03025, partial [Thermoanaerobaculia bacterium]
MRTAPRFVLVVCLFFASRLYGQAPIVENEVRHDTSAPLGGVPAAPREVITPRIRPIERVPTRTGRARALVLDAVEQLAPGPAAAFTAAVPSIDGLGRGLDGKGFQMTSVPPDTTGAIGTTQYVQAVNTSLLVIDKATRNIVLNPVLLKTVWKGFGGACETENDGDPIVLFDRIAKRWVITQFQVSQGHSQCVAISTTDDALGSYHRYEFSYPAMND